MSTYLQISTVSKYYSSKENKALENVSLEINKGELVALVGESGSGKTTLLRVIAGLEKAQDGSLVVDDKLLFDQKSFTRPEKRKIGMVFQDYALFPHMTVEKNVAFGLPKNANKKQIVEETLDLVGLSEFAKRYPHELSGGQQQRVALARAIAPKPSVILLDEPFSNLDEVLKEQVREDLKKIIRIANTTAIFVTHDTKDALGTADRIAILKKGKLQQFDSPQNLYIKPLNKYVASFFGYLNYIDVKNEFFKSLFKNERCIELAIRPSDIKVSKTDGEFEATLEHLTFLGEHTELKFRLGGELIKMKSLSRDFTLNDNYFLTFPSEKILYFGEDGFLL